MKKNKGLFLFIAGLLTLILGLYLIVFPSKTYFTNIYIMCLGLVTIGVFYILSYISNKAYHFRPGWTLSQGFYMVIMGVLFFFTFDKELSDSTNIIFAMWALACGTSQIASSIKIRSLEYTKWWAILLYGIINLLFFIYFVVNPLSNVISSYISNGAYFVVSGLICFSEQFNYKATLK